MTSPAALADHATVCDQLHQLALEENRFLRTEQRPPERALLERKQVLLGRLDQTVAALRSLPSASARAPEVRALLDNSRARILQILQLDQENEQLLLRCSLMAARPSAAVPPPATLLQKIYARTAPAG
jgi:hypothetical protein